MFFIYSYVDIHFLSASTSYVSPFVGDLDLRMVVSSKRLDCPTQKSLFGLYIRVVVANVEKEVRVVGIASFCRCTVDLRSCFVLSYISGFLMPLPKMLGFFFITMLSFICPYESVNYHNEA